MNIILVTLCNCWVPIIISYLDKPLLENSRSNCFKLECSLILIPFEECHHHLTIYGLIKLIQKLGLNIAYWHQVTDTALNFAQR